MGYAVASLIGDLAFFFWGKGRRYTIDNMRQVLGPMADQAQVHHLARETLRNYCKTLADFLYLPKLTGEDVDRLVSFDRWDLFDRALAPGKGAIFVTAHMGSWDLGGAAMGRKGYPFTVLVDAFPGAALNRRIVEIRQEKGFSIIPARGVPKAAVKT
ncbi:MAG: hypothetical protein Q8P59_02965, partial [Dehalococcoidia bacterium]|nr:hypothetical protein [Dehalococcoidia bacterium]